MADVDAVLGLMRPFYEKDGYAFREETARAALGHLLQNPVRGAVWVAERDGKLAAYVVVTLGYSLEYGGLDALLDELVVAEGARGQGFGRAALEVVEAYCRAENVRMLHLEVEPVNEPAVRLYRASGFVDHRRRVMTKRMDA